MFYLRNRLSVGAAIEAHEHDEVVPVPQERGAVGKGRRVAPVQRGREHAEPEDGHVLHDLRDRDPALEGAVERGVGVVAVHAHVHAPVERGRHVKQRRGQRAVVQVQRDHRRRGGVVPEVQRARRAPARQQDHRVEPLPKLGRVPEGGRAVARRAEQGPPPVAPDVQAPRRLQLVERRDRHVGRVQGERHVVGRLHPQRKLQDPHVPPARAQQQQVQKGRKHGGQH